MNSPMHFSIQSNYGGLTYDLFLHIRHHDGRISLPESALTMRTMSREDAQKVSPPPVLCVQRETLQNLIDELWHQGIRPTEGHGSTGQLAATEKHLDHTTKLLDQTLQTVLNVANASLLTRHNLEVVSTSPTPEPNSAHDPCHKCGAFHSPGLCRFDK